MGLKKCLIFLSILFCFIYPSESHSIERKPKIGLVLSGGGARGISHIGVLRKLEALQIPIHAITGTSIGAFVGAMYVSGYSVDEIEKFFKDTDWEDIIFNDRIGRENLPFRRKTGFEKYLFNFEVGFKNGSFVLPSGLVYGQKMSLLLDSVFLRSAHIRDFSQLKIPFKAVASDVETGEMVILEKGNLADSIRASAAYPGLFSPVEINGRLLLDGGNVNNLPVDLAKEMGVDTVIAVDVSTPLNSRDNLSSFVDVSDQFVTMMMRRTTQEQIKKADIALVPSLPQDSTFAFTNFESLIRAGQKSVEEKESQLKKLQVSEKEYLDYQNKYNFEPFQIKKINQVQVNGFKRVSSKTIERQIHMKAGDNFKLKSLNEDLEEIYSDGDFERTDFEIINNHNENILSIRAREKTWGPTYLHLGVMWDGEIKGKRDGNAVININATRLNSLSAEWNTDIILGTKLKLETEFYQPLDYSGIFFFAPRFSVSRSSQNFYEQTVRIADYEIDSLWGGFDLGINFLHFCELRGGIRRGIYNSEVALGTTKIPSFDIDTAAVIAETKIDTLNSAYFPTEGFYASGDFISSRDYLGATDEYRKIYGQILGFGTISRLTGFIHFSAGGNLSSHIPVYDEFLVGGFQSFSGYREEELRGQHFGVAKLGAMYRLPVPKTFFWNRVFFGSWYEAGNTWNQKRDIDRDHLKQAGTAALGVESKLGAIFLAYGQSGSKNKQFYISVGRPFGIRPQTIY